MGFLYEDGFIIAEYRVAMTTSASTAIPITLGNSAAHRVICESVGCDTIFCFGGNSSTAASSTPDSTTKLLPVGNFSIQDGAIFATNLNNTAGAFPSITRSDNRIQYFSGIAVSGSGTAVIKVIRGV